MARTKPRLVSRNRRTAQTRFGSLCRLDRAGDDMTTIAIHRPARSHPRLPPGEPVRIPLPPTLPDRPGRLAATLTALSPLMLSLGSVAVILGSGAGRGWLVYILPALMVTGVTMSMGVRWAQTRAGDRK